MNLYCDITLPTSKSESNRALMIASYGGFALDFQNLSESNDTIILNGILRGLSSTDSFRNDIEDNPRTINIADCGTAARFLTTYLASHHHDRPDRSS